ncbi:hypothetical protein, unlikely [Trypanosoma brucei gambiense DAL972]|uniref:Uncharacterized protein n=1 Tax=Trypanosoma brucei gambiense (strain MHOM/CI/86/DAL972) TaxID=679716 RepID=C9ZZ21_TRYB9|nr:hypothetical protein, unlikely [Trypanosoma brucei gambiense DAL972]CBH14670.1 hypothetical protein, unlikely [Trypanosoma brucei gambiense DAL972]|eukprot:XP_011776936.1 hypothetical protein, unlikely [Trypanosoma brucei gambiense DAL972]
MGMGMDMEMSVEMNFKKNVGIVIGAGIAYKPRASRETSVWRQAQIILMRQKKGEKSNFRPAQIFRAHVYISTRRMGSSSATSHCFIGTVAIKTSNGKEVEVQIFPESETSLESEQQQEG